MTVTAAAASSGSSASASSKPSIELYPQGVQNGGQNLIRGKILSKIFSYMSVEELVSLRDRSLVYKKTRDHVTHYIASTEGLPKKAAQVAAHLFRKARNEAVDLYKLEGVRRIVSPESQAYDFRDVSPDYMKDVRNMTVGSELYAEEETAADINLSLGRLATLPLKVREQVLTLNLWFCQMDPPTLLALLELLPNLRELCLKHLQITQDILKILNGREGLRRVYLQILPGVRYEEGHRRDLAFHCVRTHNAPRGAPAGRTDFHQELMEPAVALADFNWTNCSYWESFGDLQESYANSGLGFDHYCEYTDCYDEMYRTRRCPSLKPLSPYCRQLTGLDFDCEFDREQLHVLMTLSYERRCCVKEIKISNSFGLWIFSLNVFPMLQTVQIALHLEDEYSSYNLLNWDIYTPAQIERIIREHCPHLKSFSVVDPLNLLQRTEG